jgi:Ca-activated chloride channel family protein
MLTRYQPRKQRAAQLMLLLAVALLAVAMLNPQEPKQQAGNTLNGLEIVVALDVSNSMMAKDASPNRLERSKIVARQLIDTLQGSKVGIVAFAGEAWTQLPLTTDLSAARLLLSSVQPNSVPVQGTNIEDALLTANNSLPTTDMSHKAIVLFTDGESLEGDVEAAVTELKKSGVMLLAVGVGTAAGATVTDEDGLALRKDDGTPVVSQLNEKALQQMATATGGQYIPLQNNPDALPQMMAALTKLPRQPLANSYMVNYNSYSHWLIAVALVLLLAAVFVQQRLPLQKKKLQAALIATGVLLAQFSFAQSSKANLQKANELMVAGKFDEAENLYRSILQQDPKAWHAQLHLGNIAYRKGQYDEALKQYEQTLQQPMPDEAAIAALNNKGLAFVKMKKLPEAVETFKQAVRKAPFDDGLQANLGMALDELAKAKATQPPPAQKPMNQRKADDQLQALQQEEKKIRQQLMKQKRSVPNNGRNW